MHTGAFDLALIFCDLKLKLSKIEPYRRARLIADVLNDGKQKDGKQFAHKKESTWRFFGLYF